MSPHFFRYCPIKSTYNCDGNDISNVNSIIESFALALGTIMLVKIKIPIKISTIIRIAKIPAIGYEVTPKS